MPNATEEFGMNVATRILMSDRPLLADERPRPVGDEVKALNRDALMMRSNPVSRDKSSNSVRKTSGRRVITVRLDSGDYSRLKNAVNATSGVTEQSFCEGAILKALEEMEEEHGGPFPPARQKRPMNQSPSRHVIDLYV